MNNNNLKILLVEDDMVDQMAFKRMVSQQQLDYSYAIANSVAQARQSIQDQDFDIVIVDYMLGDGTAFDVLQIDCRAAVIVATGAGNEELAVKAMKAGAYEYLIKDTQRNYLKVLPEKIKKAVRAKQAEQQLQQYHEQLEQLVAQRTQELQAEKERLAVTVSSMSDGVIAVDNQKRVVLFNKVAEDLTGYQLEQVKGQDIDSFLRVIDEKKQTPADNPINMALQTGVRVSGGGYDCLVDKSGTNRPVSLSAAPICKKGGDSLGVVMVLRDMSRQREIDHMKADFVSSVSHELRTPLTSIKAYTATILRDRSMDENIKTQFLEIIDAEADRLGRIIEDLLEISRMESGKTRLKLQDVDLAKLLQQVGRSLEPLAAKKEIRLAIVVDPDLPRVQGDPGKLESMMINLINNAIKFTDPPGRIMVTLSGKNDSEIEFEVSDTGKGIPPESLHKIFDRFYRVNRPGTQIQGTGLGLAITKKIVEAHGGYISVDSQLDKGTTFTACLPAKEACTVS